MDIQLQHTPVNTSFQTTSNYVLSVIMSGIFLFGGISNTFSLHFFLKQRPVTATGVIFRMITLVDLMTCVQASLKNNKIVLLEYTIPPVYTHPIFLLYSSRIYPTAFPNILPKPNFSQPKLLQDPQPSDPSPSTTSRSLTLTTLLKVLPCEA